MRSDIRSLSRNALGSFIDFRVVVAWHATGRIFQTLRASGRHGWLWTVMGALSGRVPGRGVGSAGADVREARLKGALYRANGSQ